MDTQFLPSMVSHQVMPPPDQVNGWHCRACGTTTCSSLLTLPSCGHRFCMSCMDLWLWEYVSKHGGHGRRYPCQVCWEMYQIPPDGLEAFLQNVNVLRLEVELQQLSMGSGVLRGQTVEEQNGNVEGPEQTMEFMTEERRQDQAGNFSSYEENCRPGNNCALVPYCQLPTHMF